MQWFNACLWKKKIAPISSSVAISLEQDWTPLRNQYVTVNKKDVFELLDKMENILKEMEGDILLFQEGIKVLQNQDDIYSTPLESKKSTMS